MTRLSPGDEAPNFDLTSTEDVVLMLRDEVSRTAALLYFFDVEAEGSREAHEHRFDDVRSGTVNCEVVS